MLSTSFTAKSINSSTFLVCERDAYGELPFIYVKVHPRVPVIVLSDTGCDKPNKLHRHDDFVHLREWLERCPVDSHTGPLNPEGKRHYIVICTHCHYDHVNGIAQFASRSTTDIIASVAGRDFVEHGLATHGLFKDMDLPTPSYAVTKWAQSFERLRYPINGSGAVPQSALVDLCITIIHTPGHTPDELAWYDHEEMHLYVGDSFYEEGDEGMPIFWPSGGNMIEWYFSLQKLQTFIMSENRRAEEHDPTEEEFVIVSRRVLVSCGHQTSSVDGEQFLKEVETFWCRVAKSGICGATKHQEYHFERLVD